jgi:ABC-type phosphate transport system substrate-binding protein
MFSNTIVLTVNSVAKTLTKINQDSYASEYLLRDVLDSFRLKIRHSVAKRGLLSFDRHNVEIVHTVYATTTTVEIVRKVYLVFEQDTADTVTFEVKALADWLIASSNAAIVSLSNWES